jgi:hypothetical protein
MAQEQRQQERATQLGQVVAKAWQDEAFKQRLLGDPRAALQEQGLPLPAGKAVRVVENTAETVHLVLPARPADGDRSAERLAQVAGEQQEPGRKLGQVVAKAWQDDAFKRRLLEDPQVVLQEQGLPLPAGKAVRVVEDTTDTVHLVLPLKPAEGELSDEQLDQVSGGLLAELGDIFFGIYSVMADPMLLKAPYDPWA